MSTLADQLRGQTAAGQDQRIAESKSNFRPSYIFSPKQAASLSNNDIFGLGQNGFAALCQITPALLKFEPALFSDTAKLTDRALLPKEENQQLDENIDKCLSLFGPSVLVRPCGQALEWLIRRFRIQDFNVRAVLALMLPYHETPQFAQMLQLLPLEKTPMLNALVPVKKSMQPMSRHTLVKSMTRSSDLLHFVLNTLPTAVKRDTTHQTLVSFWTATLVAYLDLRPSVTQEELSMFFAALFEVIKAKDLPDCQLAAYIVVAHLTSKTLLTQDALETIINLIAVKRTTEERERLANDEASLTTVVSICLRQEELSLFPARAFAAYVQRPAFLQTLQQLHQTSELTPFLRPFFKTFAEEAKEAQKAAELSPLADGLLQIEPCPAYLLASACLVVLARDLKEKEEDGDAEEADEDQEVRPAGILVQTLARLRQRFAEPFGQAVQEAASQDSKGAAKAMEAIMAVERSGASLSQGARDADEGIRLLAYQQLLSAQAEQPLSRDDAQAILKDPSPTVTALIDAHAQAILAVLSPEEIVHTCQSAIESDSLPRASLGHLSSFLAHAFLTRHPSQKEQVVQALWSRLLWTKAGKKSTALVWQALANSSLAKAELKPCFPLKDTSSSEAHMKLNRSAVAGLAQLAGVSAQLRDFVVQQSGAQAGAGNTSNNLALLVTTALLSSPAVATSASVHASLAEAFAHVPQNLEALENRGVLLDDRGTPSDATLFAASAKPKSPKTRAKLLVCMMMRLAETFPVDVKLAWNWLDRSAAVSACRTVARAAFYLAHASGHGQVRNHFFKSLFTHILGQDALAFLASIWSESITTAGVTLAALQDAVALLRASHTKFSFQLLLPTILVPLSHQDRDIREAALELLTVLHQNALSTSGTYGEGQIYGKSTKHLVGLESKDYSNYLKALLAHRTAIELSGSAIVSAHAGLGDKVDDIKKPKKLQHHVAEFLASTLTVSPNSTSFRCILDVISAIKQPDAAKLLLPAMQSLLTSSNSSTAVQFEPEMQEHCSDLLFKSYESSKAVSFEAPSSPTLQFLRGVIATQPTSLTVSLFRQKAFNLLKTASFYRKLSLASRMEMIEFLVLQALNPETPIDSAECLSDMHLDSDTLAALLQGLHAHLENTSAVPKRSKASQTIVPTRISDAPQQALTLLLERLAFNRLPVDARVFQAVFELATLFAGDQTLVSSELAFIKQRLIIALSDCLSSISAQELASLREMRIAPLMDMLRTSPNPQTTHRILSLIAQLTTVVPDQVIQNIIPLFTFMGTSVSQRDDAFAQKVLTKVINYTLPVLVSKTKETAKTHAQLVTDLSDVLRTLTGLASHIPRFRRATLFAQIVGALGPQDFLAPVMLMLLGDQATEKPLKAHDLADRLNTTFTLLEGFSARDQLAALCQLASECQQVLATSSGPAAQMRAGVIVAFLRQVFEDRRFVSKVDAARSKNIPVFDSGLQNVIKALVLLQSSFSDAQVSEDAQITVRQIARLLSSVPLSDVIVWLVTQDSKVGLLGGFALLRQSLSALKGSKGDARRPLLFPAIEASSKQLCNIISNVNNFSTRPDLEESVATVKEIARSCAPTEPTGLFMLVDAIVPALEDESLDATRRGLLLGTLPALLRNLGARLLPKAQQMAKIAKSACHYNSSSIQEQGLDTLQAILQHLSNFVAPFVQDLLAVSLSEDTLVKDRLKALRGALGRQVPIKTLSPALVKAWKPASKQPKQLFNLLQLIKTSLDAAEPADVLSEHKRLFQLLLQSWDYEGEMAAEVHASATSAFLAMVLKLNESAFKPILLRTIDWAFVEADAKQAPSRQQQMLSIMSALLQALKIVVLPYFSYLVDPLSTLFEGFISTSSSLYDSQENLWKQALSTLKAALTLDREGFWTEGRLRKLIAPVVGQLQLAGSLPQSAFEEHFRPTLCAFVEQMSPLEDVLKDANAALLDQTRSDQEDSTRAEALWTLSAVWRAVRDPMLPLVPPTTPFLVEALEERGEVVAAARELVSAVEDCLGEESLADYMT